MQTETFETLGFVAFCTAVLLAAAVLLWFTSQGPQDCRGIGGRAPDSVALEPTVPAPQAGPSKRGRWRTASHVARTGFPPAASGKPLSRGRWWRR